MAVGTILHRGESSELEAVCSLQGFERLAQMACSYLDIVVEQHAARAVQALGFSPTLGEILEFMEENSECVDHDRCISASVYEHEMGTVYYKLFQRPEDKGKLGTFPGFVDATRHDPSLLARSFGVQALRMKLDATACGSIEFFPGKPEWDEFGDGKTRSGLWQVSAFVADLVARVYHGAKLKPTVALARETSSGLLVLKDIPGAPLDPYILLKADRRVCICEVRESWTMPGDEALRGQCFTLLTYGASEGFPAVTLGELMVDMVLPVLPAALMAYSIQDLGSSYHVGFEGEKAMSVLAKVRFGLPHDYDLSRLVMGPGDPGGYLRQCPSLSKVSGRAARLQGLTTAFTLPSRLGADGRRERRVLSCLGDAAITKVIAIFSDAAGFTAQTYQDTRGSCSNRAQLAEVFYASPMCEWVVGKEDVRRSAGVGGETLEAVVGVVDKLGGDSAVWEFCILSGIFPPRGPAREECEAMLLRYRRELEADESTDLLQRARRLLPPGQRLGLLEGTPAVVAEDTGEGQVVEAFHGLALAQSGSDDDASLSDDSDFGGRLEALCEDTTVSWLRLNLWPIGRHKRLKLLSDLIDLRTEKYAGGTKKLKVKDVRPT